MALTPADVHNVAFSRPRIGKRGYNEQEVDLFIDLVEQELARHVTADAQLRKLNAELRNRIAAVKKRERELAEREAKLVEREGVLRRQVRRHESELNQQKAELAEREAKLGPPGNPLRQQVAQLRHREAQVAQREAQLERREAELAEAQAERPRQEGANGAVQQLTTALQKSAAVNGTPRLDNERALASVDGRHDIERMAIRAITDTLGNTVTETVHERTRRSRIDHDGQAVAVELSTELERLREENAELAHTLGLLKSAAALLAAALDRT
jgi:DivIVA domain-containing protein